MKLGHASLMARLPGTRLREDERKERSDSRATCLQVSTCLRGRPKRRAWTNPSLMRYSFCCWCGAIGRDWLHQPVVGLGDQPYRTQKQPPVGRCDRADES